MPLDHALAAGFADTASAFVASSVAQGFGAEEGFTAQTSVVAVAQILRIHGLPDRMTFDRDTRFVGSWSSRDYPSPFVRFWTCLGAEVSICPPHRPDTNAFVERSHRSSNSECLQADRPGAMPLPRASGSGHRGYTYAKVG